MSVANDLEAILKDLPGRGELVKDRGYRQVWRFATGGAAGKGGKGYYLKFFPRPGSRVKRAVRGNPAMREFLRMQWLQKAKIPSPRAVAVLNGYVVKGVKGDAVISEAIEPATPLDAYLNGFELRGERAPDHLQLSAKVRELVFSLGKAGLGHSDLHLGNFLRAPDGNVYLLDAYAVTPGGLKMAQILQLGHSAARYATRGDVRRAWAMFAPGAALPRVNTASWRPWRKFVERIGGDGRYFEKIESGEWRGVYFAGWKYPYRWSPASQLKITAEDWAREWPRISAEMEAEKLLSLKRGNSGDVWAGEVTLGGGGRAVPVVIKRPRRKRWWRYVNEIGRGARAWRAWKKGWSLIARNLPTAWPLIVMERRTLGYVTDQVIVCERVPGPTLATQDLDAVEPGERDQMFRRCGRILRRIETTGMCHFDAKASNWIMRPDDRRGPTPVMVDVDGIRFYRWDTFGIRRLLRSMLEHPQYTPADSLALCQGYAPFTRMEAEPEDEPDVDPESDPR
ncbi:MAG TPA: lipopolysaccharide kinase InaA family protein [Tepidisphaeraceae bacterium]|nr:lipopolysaccharide kinase InaA family protein [Tepidisphaeraceae bacterium]